MSKSKAVDSFLLAKKRAAAMQEATSNFNKVDKEQFSAAKAALGEAKVSQPKEVDMDDVRSQATPGHEWKGDYSSSRKRAARQSMQQDNKNRTMELER